jgi:hypothetical protein
MEHWWNATDKGKPKDAGGKMSLRTNKEKPRTELKNLGRDGPMTHSMSHGMDH